MAAVKKAGFEGEEVARVHRIRITLTSRNVPALEKVCADLKKTAEDKGLKGKVSGPVRLPTKVGPGMMPAAPSASPELTPMQVLHITTRMAPGGEGSKTWDRFEMRIHKRIIDLHAPADIVKQVTAITIEPGVEVEVTVADKPAKTAA